ncbi:MAG: hypothetical protein JWP95_78, partial [Actinotalea sp.]|nr:hypothetical protein [Actinotalea sp.]
MTMGLFRRRSAPSGPPITAPEHHPPADPPPSPQREDGSCDPLTDLADLALAHAVRSVVPEGGPLIPFAMVETAEGRSLARFVGELGEAQEKARAHVRTT